MYVDQLDVTMPTIARDSVSSAGQPSTSFNDSIFRLDLFYLHDWQTELFRSMPDALPRAPDHWKGWNGIDDSQSCFSRTVPGTGMERDGAEEGLFSVEGLEFWNDWSMIKGAILWADQITTGESDVCERDSRAEDGYGWREASGGGRIVSWGSPTGLISTCGTP